MKKAIINLYWSALSFAHMQRRKFWYKMAQVSAARTRDILLVHEFPWKQISSDITRLNEILEKSGHIPNLWAPRYKVVQEIRRIARDLDTFATFARYRF